MSVLFTQKLLQQSYEEEKLKMTLRKFYEQHHEFVVLKQTNYYINYINVVCLLSTVSVTFSRI